jgi:hypothetical protein
VEGHTLFQRWEKEEEGRLNLHCVGREFQRPVLWENRNHPYLPTIRMPDWAGVLSEGKGLRTLVSASRTGWGGQQPE